MRAIAVLRQHQRKSDDECALVVKRWCFVYQVKVPVFRIFLHVQFYVLQNTCKLACIKSTHVFYHAMRDAAAICASPIESSATCKCEQFSPCNNNTIKRNCLYHLKVTIYRSLGILFEHNQKTLSICSQGSHEHVSQMLLYCILEGIYNLMSKIAKGISTIQRNHTIFPDSVPI